MERLKIVLNADTTQSSWAEWEIGSTRASIAQKIPLLIGVMSPGTCWSLSLIVVACGAVVIYLGCTLESPGKLKKILMPGSHPRDSGPGYSLEWGTLFWESPGSEEAKLRNTVLGNGMMRLKSYVVNQSKGWDLGAAPSLGLYLVIVLYLCLYLC